MPQELTFQDERQEFRATAVVDFPYLSVVDARILHFVNAARGLTAVSPTEHVNFDGSVIQILLADGRSADYLMTVFSETSPEYVLTTVDSWSSSEQESIFEVLRTLSAIQISSPLSEMRWEVL